MGGETSSFIDLMLSAQNETHSLERRKASSSFSNHQNMWWKLFLIFGCLLDSYFQFSYVMLWYGHQVYGGCLVKNKLRSFSCLQTCLQVISRLGFLRASWHPRWHEILRPHRKSWWESLHFLAVIRRNECSPFNMIFYITIFTDTERKFLLQNKFLVTRKGKMS